MVSVEYYFKRFFRVMPKRFKVISDLLNEKAKLTKRLMDAEKAGNSEKITKTAAELIEILGEDTIFGKAETKRKNTLRYFVWKISKSMDYYRTSNILAKKILGGSNVSIQIYNLQGYLSKIMPEMEMRLDSLDSTYKNEVSVLKGIMNGEARVSEYFNLVAREKKSTSGLRPLFSGLQARNKTFIDTIKQFRSSLKSHDTSVIKGISHLGVSVLALAIGLTLSYIAFNLIVDREPGLISNLILMNESLVLAMISLSLSVGIPKDVYNDLMIAVKFVRENMI